MKLFKTTLIATALVAAGFVGNASAATATTNMDVTITLTASCTVAATPIAFGSVAGNVSAGDKSKTGTITVNCTPNTAYKIGLDAGKATSATVTARAMTGQDAGNSTAKVGYGLYTDAAFATNWNDVGGASLPGTTGTGADQTYTVHAKVPAAELAKPAGNYKDTVLVTVSY